MAADGPRISSSARYDRWCKKVYTPSDVNVTASESECRPLLLLVNLLPQTISTLPSHVPLILPAPLPIHSVDITWRSRHDDMTCEVAYRVQWRLQSDPYFSETESVMIQSGSSATVEVQFSLVFTTQSL